MARRYRKRRHNYSDVFEKSFAFLTDREFQKFLVFIRDELKSAIINQKYNWAPLTQDYADLKAQKNLDPRILISTSQYLDAIKIRYRKEGKAVGLPLTGLHKNVQGGTDLPFHTLAAFLEYGTSSMPARQHWRPTQSKAVREFNQTKKEVAKALRDRASEVFSGIKKGRLRFK